MEDAAPSKEQDPSGWRAAAMRLAQEGDSGAYRELLDDSSSLLRRYLAKHIRGKDDLEDVLQEVLLSVHRGRHSYDPGRPFEPWLFAIARNVKADYLRRTISRQTWEVLVDEQPEQAAQPESSARLLSEALDSLPESQREAFRHLKIEGRSVEEAAALVGTTEGNLRVRAHRAYKALRAFLAR